MRVEAGSISKTGATTVESGTRDRQIKGVEAGMGEGEEEVVVRRVDKRNTSISIWILIGMIRIILHVSRCSDRDGGTS